MKTIFVIDDDSLYLKMMSFKISELGHKVYCFLSVEDALPHVSRNPDLIILDHNFENMQSKGRDYIPLLKSISKKSSLLYITSETDESVIKSSLSNGADMYLEKNENTPYKINSTISTMLADKPTTWISSRLS